MVHVTRSVTKLLRDLGHNVSNFLTTGNLDNPNDPQNAASQNPSNSENKQNNSEKTNVSQIPLNSGSQGQQAFNPTDNLSVESLNFDQAIAAASSGIVPQSTASASLLAEMATSDPAAFPNAANLPQREFQKHDVELLAAPPGVVPQFTASATLLAGMGASDPTVFPNVTTIAPVTKNQMAISNSPLLSASTISTIATSGNPNSTFREPVKSRSRSLPQSLDARPCIDYEEASRRYEAALAEIELLSNQYLNVSHLNISNQLPASTPSGSSGDTRSNDPDQRRYIDWFKNKVSSGLIFNAPKTSDPLNQGAIPKNRQHIHNIQSSQVPPSTCLISSVPSVTATSSRTMATPLTSVPLYGNNVPPVVPPRVPASIAMTTHLTSAPSYGNNVPPVVSPRVPPNGYVPPVTSVQCSNDVSASQCLTNPHIPHIHSAQTAYPYIPGCHAPNTPHLYQHASNFPYHFYPPYAGDCNVGCSHIPCSNTNPYRVNPNNHMTHGSMNQHQCVATNPFVTTAQNHPGSTVHPNLVPPGQFSFNSFPTNNNIPQPISSVSSFQQGNPNQNPTSPITNVPSPIVTNGTSTPHPGSQNQNPNFESLYLGNNHPSGANGGSNSSSTNPFSPNYMHQSNTASFGLQLPPINIEPFDGNIAEYKEFKIKMKSILSMGQYPDEMKVIFLKAHLTGDPEESVSSILPNEPGAYDNIWEVLDEDYGIRELGFDHHLNLLLSISSWSPCTSDNDLKNLYRHISSNYAALKHYGPEAVFQAEAAKIFILPLLSGHAAHKITKLHEDGNNYTIPAILRILKTIISHQKFVDTSKNLKHDSKKTNKMGKKCMFIKSECPEESSQQKNDTCQCLLVNSQSPDKGHMSRHVTFEKSKRRNQSPSPNRSNSRDRVRYVTPSRSPSPIRFCCPFCETNEHEVKSCPLYDNRDSYWKHILRKRWCSNCLEPGHQWRKCFQDQSCHLSCDRIDKHVSVLCDKFYSKSE